jgi:GTP-binding protein
MTVAIIGRPNVGKSTLFNRLCKLRQAITHADPGVTRDLGYAMWDLGDLTSTLVDSGGVVSDRVVSDRVVSDRVVSDRVVRDRTADEPLAGQVSGRARDAATAADVVLLVVDFDGPTADDHTLAEDLRRCGKDPIVAVNKADHAARDVEAARFHELGFRDVVAISAAHGRGIDTLTDITRGRLAAAGEARHDAHDPVAEEDEQDDVVRLALLGRPNTGKSTLLNALTGRSLALVDATPGTTRDPVTGRFAADGVRFEVVDTAGLRRRARVHEPVEYYSTQRSVAALEQSDVVVLLADAQEEIAEQDKRLASLAVRKGNGLVVALNKWDLFQPHQRDQVIARARYHLPALAYVPLVTLSARERTGVSSLTEACVAVSRQRARLVSTSRINDAVRRWNRTPGAADSGRRAAPGRPPLRVQYGVQTGTSPVRLLFFVNRAQVPAHYRRFLENRARADLGFDRVPIIIEVRGPPGRERPGRERPGRERPGRERSGRR